MMASKNNSPIFKAFKKYANYLNIKYRNVLKKH